MLIGSLLRRDDGEHSPSSTRHRHCLHLFHTITQLVEFVLEKEREKNELLCSIQAPIVCSVLCVYLLGTFALPPRHTIHIDATLHYV